MLNVLHLAAECAPLAKVGGLGDVVGALPKYLDRHGVGGAVAMPRYGHLRLPAEPEIVYEGAFEHEGRSLSYRVLRLDALGFPLYLFDEPEHFGGHGVYQDATTGLDFPNQADRFIVFQRAVLDWLLHGGQRFDVLHTHDHHTGLVPLLVKEAAPFESIRETPVVFTVHSAEHQGVYPWEKWTALSEALGHVNVPSADLQTRRELNSMKAALLWADRVTTVSPSYAEELTTKPAYAHGLADTFRQVRGKTVGLLNGIDPEVWSPETDAYLPAHFSAADLSGKAACKRAVCEEMGVAADRPLVVYVGRLMEEKGAELLPDVLARVVTEHDASAIVLGTGKPHFEARMREVADAVNEGTPEGQHRLAVRLAFDEGLAHRLYAGADLFLMPSLVEPCGLGQLYAMAYGTPPIVHATGGLRDTVTAWDGTTGTGFRFEAYTADAALEAAADALAVLADDDQRAALMQQDLAADWSWPRAAGAYAALYRDLAG